MGGEGSMLHMINTLKENRRLKKSIRKHLNLSSSKVYLQNSKKMQD